MATLKLIPNPTNNHYELAEDLLVKVGGKTLWVPAGFHYDGASIPPVAWPITYTPFAPDVMRAALVHDWLYHAHEDADDEESRMREEADEILFRLLIEDTVSSGKAKLMWMAVRTAGGIAWRNDRGDRDVVKEVYLRHEHDADIEKFKFPTWVREP